MQPIAASGLTMDPYGPNSNPNTGGTFQNYLDTWSVEEETLAGYLQAAFVFDNAVVPISALLGVRYFDTNTCRRATTGCNRRARRVVTFPTASQAGGYTDWLPSINVRFDFTDKFVGRLTAGDVMARPNPSQMAFRRRSTRHSSDSRVRRAIRTCCRSRPRSTTWVSSTTSPTSATCRAAYFRTEISPIHHQHRRLPAT